MPDPDCNLEVGSGTHHAQTAKVMERFGEVVQKDRSDLIVVVGDVNPVWPMLWSALRS